MRRMCFISLYEQPISIALLLSTRIGMTFLCSGPSLAEHLPSHSAASSNEPSPFKSHRLLCIPILQKKGQQGQANSSFDQACCPCRTFKKHQYCDQSPLHHSKMSYCKLRAAMWHWLDNQSSIQSSCFQLTCCNTWVWGVSCHINIIAIVVSSVHVLFTQTPWKPH